MRPGPAGLLAVIRSQAADRDIGTERWHGGQIQLSRERGLVVLRRGAVTASPDMPQTAVTGSGIPAVQVSAAAELLEYLISGVRALAATGEQCLKPVDRPGRART